ncbi:TPA: hypothetical protein NEG48_002910 [Elizabethkingia anophelis]|nr:hypothetical protein [Elizabethkingia anophelis]
MQIISHKKSDLKVCEKFFIEKSIELLYYGTIDSYRVKLNNSKTILEELKYCIDEFEIGRIRHFSTIKGKEKDKKALVDEVIKFVNEDENYLNFISVSKDYLLTILKELNEYNYKKVSATLQILLKENEDYLSRIIKALKILIDQDLSRFDHLSKIDKILNLLFSELVSKGFSKGFLYKFFYGVFVNNLLPTKEFNLQFNSFEQRILNVESEHTIIYRLDTTSKVYDSVSSIHYSSIDLVDDINDIELKDEKELDKFRVIKHNRKFVKCNVNALDYLSALKKSNNLLSEYLDLLNLGLSDEFLYIHNRVLVIDQKKSNKGAFQNNVKILDGKYAVEKARYVHFIRKLPGILENPNIINESKEKIKSAIRYLRLGNQSTEVEHKFINYWIGLEYLFSNYESQSTINRLKEHFINSHSLAYVKRNLLSFKRNIKNIDPTSLLLITEYSTEDNEDIKNENFYEQVCVNLLSKHPLLAYRSHVLKNLFFTNGKNSAYNYITNHKENLETHFIRIYRLRNEIIHDAATNTNNELIASNLRYYLTFILNEIIDYLYNEVGEKPSIEKYFIKNEIKIGNLNHEKFPLDKMIDSDCSIEFIS